jgi:hypothetical protein
LTEGIVTVLRGCPGLFQQGLAVVVVGFRIGDQCDEVVNALNVLERTVLTKRSVFGADRFTELDEQLGFLRDFDSHNVFSISNLKVPTMRQ